MKYKETLYIDRNAIDKIERFLNGDNTEEPLLYGIRFPDNVKMIIQCLVVDDSPYVSAVLYRNNVEVCSDGSNDFVRTWSLKHNFDEYIVDVVFVSSDSDKLLDIYKKEKLQEYERASERLHTLQKGTLRSLERILNAGKTENAVIVNDALIFEIITELEQIRRNINNGNNSAKIANVIKQVQMDCRRF